MNPAASCLQYLRLAGPAVALVLLAGCASQAPSPDWEIEASSASERAVKAYLKGQTKVAQLEWNKAFDAVAATGLPSAMARMALLQCAAQTAALEMTDCPRYERYAAGADAAEQAYARYLQVQHSAADIALLPAAQQVIAQQLLANAAIHHLPQTQPLSQLTAAGVAVRSGQISRQAVEQAADIAAQQGWRRAAMAWWLLAQRLAVAVGDTAALPDIELRLQVLQEKQEKDKK